MEGLTLSRRTFLKASAATSAAAAVFGSRKRLSGLAKADEPISEGELKKVRTACRACGKMECGLWVYLKDDKVVKIEGDKDCLTSEGNCCSKSQASIQALYHPDRIKYPMKRTRPKGEDPGWVRISWDEAIDTAATQLQQIIDKYSPHAIKTLHGTSRITSYGVFGLVPALGSSNDGTTAGQVCKGPRLLSAALTMFNSAHWMALVDGVKVFTQWGSNTEISNYDDSAAVTIDRRFKAESHIVVGPRVQNLGKEADIWLPLRPGTDGAMAMGWLNVIINDGLYDKAFVQKWTNGPFLYCPDVEPTGFTWAYEQNGGTYPLEIRTRLLKESDLVEGGSVMRFAVLDEKSQEIKYFDADSGLWDEEPPAIDPVLMGTHPVTLKDGRQVQATTVFQLLSDSVAEFTPEKTGEICWVDPEKIRLAARTYASQPGNGGIHYHLAAEHNANAIQATRSILLIPSLTNNIDTPGGHRGGEGLAYLFHPIWPYQMPFGAPTLPKEELDKRMGSERFPLLPWTSTLTGAPNTHDLTTIVDAILTGKPYPVRAQISMTGSHFHAANATKNWEAYKSLDFYFAADLWFAPTVELADILVPCTHWLETQAARPSQGASGGLGAQTGPVKPLHEARWDSAVAVQIAKKMGIPWWPVDAEHAPPWWPPTLLDTQWPTQEQLNDFAVMPLGMTWDEFDAKFQQEGWMDLKKLSPDTWGTYRRFETGGLRPDKKPGFATPTMKIELLATILESYHPGEELPVYREPPHSPYVEPELAKEYPLVLTTGRRIPVYFHNEHRQLPWCRELWPVPKVEINPQTAAELNIKQGDWVWIESPKGRVRMTADLFAGIHPQVIESDHQWWYPELPAPEHGWRESNVNVLVDEYAQDSIYGATNLRAYAVKVYKAEEGAPEGIITSADDPRLKRWLPVYPDEEA